MHDTESSVDSEDSVAEKVRSPVDNRDEVK